LHFDPSKRRTSENTHTNRPSSSQSKREKERETLEMDLRIEIKIKTHTDRQRGRQEIGLLLVVCGNGRDFVQRVVCVDCNPKCRRHIPIRNGVSRTG